MRIWKFAYILKQCLFTQNICMRNFLFKQSYTVVLSARYLNLLFIFEDGIINMRANMPYITNWFSEEPFLGIHSLYTCIQLCYGHCLNTLKFNFYVNLYHLCRLLLLCC